MRIQIIYKSIMRRCQSVICFFGLGDMILVETQTFFKTSGKAKYFISDNFAKSYISLSGCGLLLMAVLV
jgi:hypothetical protein